MRTIVIINQKGGCGKTTSSINLAAGFASRGCRTLLVDMDPQSHCAAGLGVPEEKLDQTIYDALRAEPESTLNRERLVWHVCRNLDLIPSHMMLAGLESSRGGLMGQPDKELRLRSVIDRVSRMSQEADESGQVPRRYDVCLIDCSPSIGLLSYNAIAAGREVIIPVETSFFSLKGAAKQVQTVRSIARRVGMRLNPRVLATMHDPSQPLARDLLDDLRDRFGSALIPLVIRYDQTLKEAASYGQPIESFSPNATGAEDYRSLCEWLIEYATIDRPEPGPEAAEELKDQSYEPRQPEVVFPASASQETTGPSETFGSSDASEPDELLGPLVAKRVEADTACVQTPSLSRSQEMALRARNLKSDSNTQVGPAPLRRSMMPHRPVAIEVVDDRVVVPAQSPLKKVEHLLGVRAVTGGVLFVQPASVGNVVQIAGSFNAWNPALSELRHNDSLGIFELYCKLPAGSYEYKIVIDGQWTLDPHNPENLKNGIGSQNNIVRVRA